MDKTVYSFEKTNAMIPNSYTGDGHTEQDYTANKHEPEDAFAGDHSAMGLQAMSDYDLSQIMNPNVDIILEDSGFEEKHHNTNESKQFLSKVFMWIEKRISSSNNHNKAVAFSSIQADQANNTMDVVKMAGAKRHNKARLESLKRVMLIMSGCIRERESRAVAIWHEALLNQRFMEIAYQKMIYQLIDLFKNTMSNNAKRSFMVIKKYARWVQKEEERLAAEKAKAKKEKSGDIYLIYVEWLKRCLLKRHMMGFNAIKRVWTGELDAKNRFEHLEKKASVMIIENVLSKCVNNKKADSLDTI